MSMGQTLRQWHPTEFSHFKPAAVLLVRLRCGCLSHPTLREGLGPQCRGKSDEPHGAWEALENPVRNTVIFPKKDGKYFSVLQNT